MTVEEFFNKQKKIEMQALKEMESPNRNIQVMLAYIRENSNDECIANMHCYNYGYEKGRANESELNDWNSKSCYHNMKTYISMHNGELPNSYDELCQWTIHRAKEIHND